MAIMKARDLETWKVEAFSEHIDANYDADCPATQPSQCVLALACWHLAVDQLCDMPWQVLSIIG